ncbi:hypothetical protein AN2351V1_2174 [Citrobacter koseri]|nr:hypothetical protein AN2351V1_2174 [Citrobacter koseri]CAH6059342.1 hypothetical protein AN2351V1_2174 [Citrobacter koseri]STB31262.1 Uncharacterised protein [Citrobacter koseri]
MFNGNDDEQSLYWRLSVRFYPFFGSSAEKSTYLFLLDLPKTYRCIFGQLG